MIEKKNVEKQGYADILLLAVIILLAGIGFGFLYSASQPSAVRYYDNQYYFILKQGIYFFIGFVFLILGYFINPDFYRDKIKFLIFGLIILLIITLIPGVTPVIGGARRWIRIWHFSVQPSEIAKVVIIIYLSMIMAKNKERINDFYRGVLPPLIIIGVISFFIFLQNDFSTTFIIIAVTLIMLYISGVNIISLVMLLLIGLMGSAIMVIIAPYRMKRIFAFINPWNDPLGAGWHYIQSMKCFSLGGFFGKGVGESTQKYSALPEAHNDYIFAIIAEEGGVLLAVIVLLLFTVFAFLGFRIAKRANNRYRFLLASSITSIIYVQALINIGVVLSILPATGVTLPFVSAGGTSLVMFLFLTGILLQISKDRGGLIDE